MYVLDTNVVSELRKTRSNRADANVVAWISARDSSQFFISAITILELEYGTLLMARRDPRQGVVLREWMETIVYPSFAGRILPVTDTVARACAALHIPDPRPERDGMIAATALVHHFGLITRNVQDFANIGVKLTNPWISA